MGEYDSRMRMRIESKEKLIRQGESSPDYADALMLAFIGGVESVELQAENQFIPMKCFG